MTISEGAWKKASRSGGSSGNCVELADLGRGLAVRDSKYPTGPVLVVGEQARAAFISSAKRGQMDG